MRIELQENGSPIEVRLEANIGAALAASYLVNATPSLLPGHWRVAPANRVGVARVSGAELWITPKLSIQRLFFLLGFAQDGRGWRDEDLDLSEALDLLTAIADAFAREADRALQQGLIQGYRVAEESLPLLRGRLREADQMRRRFGLVLPSKCAMTITPWTSPRTGYFWPLRSGCSGSGICLLGSAGLCCIPL